MFHILSGLNHGLVQRQKSSWEKVPSKYRKTMDDLTTFMNPFHNMAKYRELQRSATPPLVPFFPILKKDLTFLYDGNETQVDGLVNFEKLRMLSQQIRVIKHFCQQPIMVNLCLPLQSAILICLSLCSLTLLRWTWGDWEECSRAYITQFVFETGTTRPTWRPSQTTPSRMSSIM